MAEGLTIIELSVENVKRLKAVRVRPEGGTVVVAGKNAQGKSSLIDSIIYLFGDKRNQPRKPVRKGQESAKIEVLIRGMSGAEYRAKKVIGSDGSQRLEVRSKDGGKYGQKFLEDLVGDVTFDPLKLVRMDPMEQAAVVRGITGLDFSDLDTEKSKLVDRRREINGEGRSKKARFDQMPEDPDAPNELVSVAELMAEADRRREHNEKVAEAERAYRDLQGRSADLKQILDRLIGERSDLLARVAVMDRDIEAAENNVYRALEQTVSGKKALDGMTRLDEASIRDDIRQSEGVNNRVRAARVRRELAVDLERLRGERDELTERISAIDEKKSEMVKSARMPIDGLGFGEDGLTFNGQPFDQCSDAEKLKVAVGIGFAQNPGLKVVLIHDGSLLDEENLRAVSEITEAHRGQIWIERVTTEGATVIIEDGEVK